MLLIAKKGTAKVAANNNAQNNHDLLAWGILVSAFINAYVATKVSSQIRILCEMTPYVACPKNLFS